MADLPILDARRVSLCAAERASGGAILDSCSVVLEPGSWISLVGPNGAGKSTLLQLLSGTLGFPKGSFRGEIYWKGESWLALSARERASRVAYVASDLNSVFPITVEEAVSSGAFASGNADAFDHAVNFCDLISLRSRTIDRLSGGERQRVALARALVQGAEVLFLDEALSNMDLDYQLDLGSRLKELLASRDKGPFRVCSVVLVSHDLSLSLRWASQAWVLYQGRVVSSGPVKQALSEEILRMIYPKAAPSLLFQK